MVAAVITSYAAFFAAMSDTAYWKIVATTPEPKCCVVCEDGNGNRCHAPVLVNLSMRSVLMGSEYPVMDTPHFLCSKLGNGFIAEQAPLLDAKELDPVLCKQVDVPLCHAPLAAYAVNALDQHQIHLTSEDGLCDLLERRAV